MKTIGIVGGGASGIIAAIAAARHKDVKVILLEHKDKLGKKILSTGNGRCNLTNEYMSLECFRSEAIQVVKQVLEKFGYEDTLRFFEEIGLITKSRNGYVYPRCDQAAAVLELLVMEVSRLNVEVHTDTHVTDITYGKKGFRILTEKESFRADKVILAAGGRAAKVLGSDGSGYTLAKSMGHSIIPIVPALVQLKVKDHLFTKASGVRTDVTVKAIINHNIVSEDTGELQITAYGISGIPIFQISRYIAKALYKKQKAEVMIDFLPAMSEENLYQFLKKRMSGRMDMNMGDFLTGIFHQKLIPELLRLAGISIKTKVGKLKDEEVRTLAHQCKHTVLTIKDTNGFDNAQVCAGGVDLQEIHIPSMESKMVPRLYLTGELLDVDGICGGYNLQWAWATGYLAGTHAAS